MFVVFALLACLFVRLDVYCCLLFVFVFVSFALFVCLFVCLFKNMCIVVDVATDKFWAT